MERRLFRHFLFKLKVFYQSKDFDPESASEKKKTVDKKGKKEESKKEEPKKDQKKKKTQGSMLDGYNLVKCEENVIATFRLELNSLLDGNAREIEQKYSIKLKEPEVKSESVLKKTDKKKETKTSADKSTKNQKKLTEQDPDVPIVVPPMELALKFELIDFSNFEELRNYFSLKVSSSTANMHNHQNQNLN